MDEFDLKINYPTIFIIIFLFLIEIPSLFGYYSAKYKDNYLIIADNIESIVVIDVLGDKYLVKRYNSITDNFDNKFTILDNISSSFESVKLSDL
jgi:hypothetical protein